MLQSQKILTLNVEGKTSKGTFMKTATENNKQPRKGSNSRKKIMSDVEVAKSKLKNGRRSIIIIEQRQVEITETEKESLIIRTF